MAALTYEQSGVNRAEADKLVEKIGLLARSTLNRKVKTAIGGYASLYEQSPGNLIAASTDGVGTKLKLAFRLGVHNTVGIDLVAMSVNDLICVGAEPLFFLRLLCDRQARSRDWRRGSRGDRRGMQTSGLRARRRRDGRDA